MASPHGGAAPLDPASVEAFKSDASSTSFLANQKALWEDTAKVSSFLGKSADFDVLFYPGGHGPMFDLASDPASLQLAAEFADAGKVVAAVCHGPAALVNVRLAGGEHLLAGKEVTGFSDAEEDSVGLSGQMPFSLEQKLNESSGGRYVKAKENWGPKVCADGTVITGQNPASAKGVGEEIVKAVEGRK